MKNLSDLLFTTSHAAQSGIYLPITGTASGSYVLPADAEIIAWVFGAGGNGFYVGYNSAGFSHVIGGASGAWGVKKFTARAGQEIVWTVGASVSTGRAGSSAVVLQGVSMIEAQGGEAGKEARYANGTSSQAATAPVHTLGVAEVTGADFGYQGQSYGADRPVSFSPGKAILGLPANALLGLAKMLGLETTMDALADAGGNGKLRSPFLPAAGAQGIGAGGNSQAGTTGAVLGINGGSGFVGLQILLKK